MGQRTVKRVPLDFDHPRNVVWPGYAPPSPRPCPEGVNCHHGLTPGRGYLEMIVMRLMTAGHDARRGEIHPWTAQIPMRPTAPPTSDLADLTAALAGRTPSGLGHDAIDNWEASAKLIEAAGFDPKTWGRCPGCHGVGHHPDDEAMLNDWEPTDPPTGDGWQLWETTSEGSPVSPVLDSPEALAEWCTPNASLFAGQRASYEQWLAMIRDDGVDVGSTMMFAYTSNR